MLQVLDIFLSGDQFAVYDNDVLLSNTWAPGGNDIGCALADPADYSYLNYALGAGDHSITIQTVAAVNGGGAAVLSATATPEPGTLALLAGGLDSSVSGAGANPLAHARGYNPVP